MRAHRHTHARICLLSTCCCPLVPPGHPPQPFAPAPAATPQQAALRAVNAGRRRATAPPPAPPSGSPHGASGGSKGGAGSAECVEPLTVVPPLPMLQGTFMGPKGLRVSMYIVIAVA